MVKKVICVNSEGENEIRPFRKTSGLNEMNEKSKTRSHWMPVGHDPSS